MGSIVQLDSLLAGFFFFLTCAVKIAEAEKDVVDAFGIADILARSVLCHIDISDEISHDPRTKDKKLIGLSFQSLAGTH